MPTQHASNAGIWQSRNHTYAIGSKLLLGRVQHPSLNCLHRGLIICRECTGMRQDSTLLIASSRANGENSYDHFLATTLEACGKASIVVSRMLHILAPTFLENRVRHVCRSFLSLLSFTPSCPYRETRLYVSRNFPCIAEIHHLGLSHAQPEED
jgi:hypothetical protein